MYLEKLSARTKPKEGCAQLALLVAINFCKTFKKKMALTNYDGMVCFEV